VDGPPSHQLTATLSRRRTDALAIVRAAIGAVSPARLLAAASSTIAADHPDIRRWHVVAVGKAAAGLYAALAAAPPTPLGPAVVIGPVRPANWPPEVPFIIGGHPYATDGSFDGARRALALADAVPADEGLLCLLSGGASALMAAPIDGLDLATKQRAVAHVMTGGADITALNALRKHLSRVKGGRLAAACPGLVRTFAVSDVIGDDLSVIGSGPTVPDPSTWQDAREAAAVFDRVGVTLVMHGHRHVSEERQPAGSSFRLLSAPSLTLGCRSGDGPSFWRVELGDHVHAERIKIPFTAVEGDDAND
jgi:hydroxypyruvate reductase